MDQKTIEGLRVKLADAQNDLRTLLLEGGHTGLKRDDIANIQRDLDQRIADAEAASASRARKREAINARALDDIVASIKSEIETTMSAFEPPAPFPGA